MIKLGRAYHSWWSHVRLASSCYVFCFGLLLVSGCGTVAPVAPSQPLPGAHAQTPYGLTGLQLDDVAPKPVKKWSHHPDLPVLVPVKSANMPAYGGATLASSKKPVSLAQVYAMALDNDPTLRAQYNELQAVSSGVKAARSGMLPKLSLDYTYTKVSSDIAQSDNTVYEKGSAKWPEKKYVISLTQPIFDLSIYQKWRQAQAQERKQLADFAFAQQDLMLRVATHYLSILAAQDQLALTAAERKITRKQFELAKTRYQSGQVTSVGIHEAQARLSVQNANYLLAQNNYKDKKQALLEIVGYAHFRLQGVTSHFLLTSPDPDNARTWVLQALKQNWHIRQAQSAVEVAERALKVQHASFYPSLDLKVTKGKNQVEGSLFGGGSTVDDTRIMLNLTVPLFQGGYAVSMSHAAASRLSASRMKLSAARRKVQRQVLSAYQGIKVGVKRIKALSQSVDAFSQTLKQKQAGYKAGLYSIVSVLDASKNLFNAKRQLAGARYTYLINTLKLKQAAGTLSEADMTALSQKLR